MHKGRCEIAVVVHRVSHGDCTAFFELQHAVSAVKTPYKSSACIVSAMKAQINCLESAENRLRQEIRRKEIERHAC